MFGLKWPQLICNFLSALKSWISAIWHPLLFKNVCLLSQYLCVQYKKKGLGSNLTTCNQDNVIRLQKWNNCNQPRLHLQSVALDNSYICLLAACHSGSLFTFWITSLKSSIPHPQGLSRRVCFSFSISAVPLHRSPSNKMLDSVIEPISLVVSSRVHLLI